MRRARSPEPEEVGMALSCKPDGDAGVAWRFRTLMDLPHRDPRDLLESDEAEGFAFDEIEDVRYFFRYGPAFVDDPQQTGLFPDSRGQKYRSPPAGMAAIAQATLLGYRTLLAEQHFSNDELLADPQQIDGYLDRLASLDNFFNEDTGLRRLPRSRLFQLDRRGRDTRSLEGTVVVLCSQEPSNFGSFMFRVLPKLQTLGRMGATKLPVVVHAGNPATRRFLELAGVRADRIIEHDTNILTSIERAIVPTLRNPDALLDFESRTFFAKLRAKFGSPTRGRRLYISRQRRSQRAGGVGRVLLNEQPLIERLLEIGFEIIEPEILSADQQIEAFSAADIVVGPAGSAMFNCVFCHPGTKLIDLESEPHWMYAHTGLFASCQLEYGIFCGQSDPDDPVPEHKRWTVDIEALVDRIQDFAR
jgi:hypothetical protein